MSCRLDASPFERPDAESMVEAIFGAADQVRQGRQVRVYPLVEE